MFNLPVIIIPAFGIVISYIIYRKIITPLGLFSIIWLLDLAIYNLNFLGYYQLSDETIDCVAYTEVFFLTGTLLGHFSKAKRVIPEYEVSTLYIYERYAHFLYGLLAIGILGFGLFIILKPVDSTSTTNIIRLSRTGEGLYRPVRELIYSVSLPCLLTIVLASSTLHSRLLNLAYNLSANLGGRARKIKKNMLILLAISSSCLIYYDLLTLGRIYIVSIISIIVMSYLITTKIIRISAKQFFVSVGVFVLIIFLLIKVTALRDIAKGFDAYISFLNYFAGPLAYFNIIINNISNYEFGRMTFGAFESFFLRPFDFLPIIGNLIPSAPNALVERQESFFISSDSRYNAFGTIMLDGYYDAGIIGVISISLLVGYISSYYYKKSNSTSSPRILCFCTLSGVWVLWSPLNWAGGFHSAGTIIFWLLILDVLVNKQRIKW